MSLGWVEVFVFLIGGVLGLPPGEHDEALVRCAPKEAIFYTDWSERSAGKAGAPGIDGLAADPEIRQFFSDVERAITTYVEDEATPNNKQAKIAAKNIFPLVRALLVRPGCLYATFDANAARAAAEKSGGQPGPSTLIAGLNGALVINGGDQADAIEQALRNLVPLLPNPPTSTELNKLSIPLPIFTRPLILHRHEKYFIVASNHALLDQAIAGLTDKSKGLLDNARFVEARKRISVERPAGVTWLDVHTAVSDVVTALGPTGGFVQAISTLVGTSEIDSVVWQTGVVNGQIRSLCLMKTGDRLPGILALAAGRGLKPADFAHVPADADLVAAVSLNLSKIYDECDRIFGNTSIGGGDLFRNEVKQLEDRLGFGIKNDLLKAFGEVWTVYDSPSEGGLFITSPVLAIEVRDAAKAQLVVDRLRKVLKDSLPGRQGSFRQSGVLLEDKPFLDRTIYFVNTLGSQMPFAPAFCLTEKHLLISVHPQAIKAQLRFVKEQGKPLAIGLGESGLREEGTTISYVAFDMRRLIRILYAFAPYAAQVFCSQIQHEGVSLDVFSLPSARAILPYVGRCTRRVTRVEKGILMETDSPLPLPDSSLLLFAAGFIGIRTSR
jgi:hypothetical protein